MITSAFTLGITIGVILMAPNMYSMLAAALVFLAAVIDLMPGNPDAAVPYLALMFIALASAWDHYKKRKVTK